jgi:hypothetical protein
MQAEKQQQTNFGECKQLRRMKLVFILCVVIAIGLIYLLFADFFHH